MELKLHFLSTEKLITDVLIVPFMELKLGLVDDELIDGLVLIVPFMELKRIEADGNNTTLCVS